MNVKTGLTARWGKEIREEQMHESRVSYPSNRQNAGNNSLKPLSCSH